MMVKGRGGDEHYSIFGTVLFLFIYNPAFHNNGDWEMKDSAQSNSLYFLHVKTQCLKYTEMSPKSLEEGYNVQL